jgi:hypothetical protein
LQIATTCVAGENMSVIDDGPSPLQLGTAVRMKFPGYGRFEGSVVGFEANHVIYSWDDGRISRHTKRVIQSCIAREKKRGQQQVLSQICVQPSQKTKNKPLKDKSQKKQQQKEKHQQQQN